MTRWVLAIDLGTSGLKVGAVGEDGGVLGSHEVALQTTFLEGGGVEQDTDQWWVGIREGVHALLSDGDIALERDGLVAVGVTGQYGSTVPVGADGRAVGPCLIWADQRGAAHSQATFGGPVAGYRPTIVVPWLRYTAGLPTPTGSDPSGHALWLRYANPKLHQRARWLLEPVDYLTSRFTGEVTATPASMVASWLTDNRPGQPPRYVPKLIELARRDPLKLPPLRRSGQVQGAITTPVADELGLPTGVPVASGVTDLQAAHIGSGALGHYQGHLAVSTTSWISCAVPAKKTDVLHQIASVPGVRDGDYLMIDNQETAGASLQWVRDRMLGPGVTFDDLTALANQSTSGAHGVVFTPWLKGERSPVDDLRLRAGFLNLSLETSKADLVRAVLEGVAYESRWLAEHADSFAGQRLDPLRMLGGGARSSLWCQIYADVLNRRIERVARPDVAQLRGVAMIALAATGRIDWGDVADRVPVDLVFEPDAATRELHDDAYRRFRSAHRRLARWYHRNDD